MNRTKIRELAFRLLYQAEIQKSINNEDVMIFFENNEIIDKDAREYIQEVIEGVTENNDVITALIKKNIKQDWTLDRISKVNIAVLKLAIYEIRFKKLAYKIAINEAVELAKKYGEEQAGSFVNGVLASILKENI